LRRDDPKRFYASLLAGAGSGALSSVLCAPLDLVRVRMQVWGQVRGQRGGGAASTTAAAGVPIRQLLREIRRNEGYRGFFKGLGATLLTVPVFWAIYFPCYDEFKAYWHRQFLVPNCDTHGTSKAMTTDTTAINPSLIHLVSAVQAGAIADIVCNPMFVVRTRLQTQALHDVANRRPALSSQLSPPSIAPARSPPTLSIAATVRSVFRESGLGGFWRGMTANLLGLSHVAIQFPLYEFLKVWMRGPKPHESPTDLLLASSLSKMMASLVSYPHEVIRSRMMDTREIRVTSTAAPTTVTFTGTCRSIYRAEGVIGFYAGLPISLVRVIPNTCVTFVTYELLLRWCTEQRGRRW
jgi:solute carrier family 25 folate transporter 32